MFDFPGRSIFSARRRVTLRSQAYDDQLRRIIATILAPGRVGVDVGANVGEILSAMVAAAPAVSHLAVEPIPQLAEALTSKFPSVRIIHGALAEQRGQAQFRVVENSLEESSLRPTTTHQANPQERWIRVDVSLLDDHVAANDDVALIKIDAEGAEHSILLGAVKTIARCRPIIVFEAGGNTTPHFGVTPEMFWTFFEQRHYALTTMDRWLARHRPFSHAEFVAAYIDHEGLPRWWERGKEWMFLACPAATA